MTVERQVVAADLVVGARLRWKNFAGLGDFLGTIVSFQGDLIKFHWVYADSKEPIGHASYYPVQLINKPHIILYSPPQITKSFEDLL